MRKLVSGLTVFLLVLFVLIGLLPMLLAVTLVWGFQTEEGTVHTVSFDVERQGVVDVIVKDHHGDDDTLLYYAISTSGQAQEIAPFEADGMTVLRVSPNSLESYIDREKNAVLNRLQEVWVYDESGQLVKNTDPLVDAVMQQAAKLEHDIMELCIMQVGEATFLHTELNVNWWCPCELYWYDPVQDRLIELYTFNALEVVGLRVRDMGRMQ